MKKKLKFLIVSSSFYPKITNTMNQEAIKYLKKLNHNYELFQVQGSLEVPTMISILLSKKNMMQLLLLVVLLEARQVIMISSVEILFLLS